MKIILLILALALPRLALAQGADPIPVVPQQQAVSAFAVQPPDTGSPFFAVRNAATYSTSQEGLQQRRNDSVAVFPRSKGSEDTVPRMFTRFFTDMFASVNLKALNGEDTTQKLQIQPTEFTLDDRRELDVSYTIRNNTKKIMRIDYPTSQRIEITTTDPQGKVIDRWSDDRPFEQRDGVVFINPKERVEYSEKLPTREMKGGETYTIESSVPNNPQFTETKAVTPLR